MNEVKIREVRRLLERAQQVTALTGAGVSAESGLPTFRGGGLWDGFLAEELSSMSGFRRNPRRVWDWYRERRQALKHARPNPGHLALAQLECRLPAFHLATQNVDRLHQAAGSRQVLELHGNIWDVRCVDCRQTFDRAYVDLPPEPRCPECGGWLRPAVVWFGEELPEGAIEQACEWTVQSQVFLVIGTSGVVYPAAGLADVARRCGAAVVEINLEPAQSQQTGDIFLQGKAGEILPALVP